ncbi:MAG: branched-chain amino acid ABC transporter permease [Rhodocyclaceae bacterium]|nr:branched-chain amino acid ABC transporter permease [Rhodocyclaceae bacterium]
MKPDIPWRWYLSGLFVMLVAPAMIYPILLAKVLCFVVFACAFNLLLGYTGLLSFGHAAFFGGGAYVAGWLLRDAGLPVLAAVGGATLFGALLGWAIGGLAIRRQGIYFAMITLAIAQLVYFVFHRASFTGGDDGMQGIPRGMVFGFDLADDLRLYFFVLAAAIAAFALIQRTIHSPFGQILQAIRENEPRAVSLGYDVDRYKLLVFVISAALSGLAGALKTVVFGFATLADSHWHTSGEVILMTLLGGVGTVLGPVIGAATVVVLHNELADKVGAMIDVFMGAIFIFCVLTFRRGIVGEGVALYKRMIGEKG